MGTIAELAEYEKISPSYLTRVMRLTLLAPDIIEAILDGNPPSVGMTELLNPIGPSSGQCLVMKADSVRHTLATKPFQVDDLERPFFISRKAKWALLGQRFRCESPGPFSRRVTEPPKAGLFFNSVPTSYCNRIEKCVVNSSGEHGGERARLWGKIGPEHVSPRTVLAL